MFSLVFYITAVTAVIFSLLFPRWHQSLALFACLYQNAVTTVVLCGVLASSTARADQGIRKNHWCRFFD